MGKLASQARKMRQKIAQACKLSAPSFDFTCSY